MAGAKAVLPPTNFATPVTFRKPVFMISDGTTTPLLTLTGLSTDPLKKLRIEFDGFGNPVGDQGNAGGDAEYGDRRSAFAPGDIFNAVWQTMTATADNVVANAAGFRLGHGTTQGVAIFVGVGAPTAANPVSTGIPPNGSVYFRSDGTVSNFLYQVRAGAWTALVV